MEPEGIREVIRKTIVLHYDDLLYGDRVDDNVGEVIYDSKFKHASCWIVGTLGVPQSFVWDQNRLPYRWNDIVFTTLVCVTTEPTPSSSFLDAAL